MESKPQAEEKDHQNTPCNCMQDPYASLPPELKPRQESWQNGLRHITCPTCGKLFWTNRQQDQCSDCQTRNPNI